MLHVIVGIISIIVVDTTNSLIYKEDVKGVINIIKRIIFRKKVTE